MASSRIERGKEQKRHTWRMLLLAAIVALLLSPFSVHADRTPATGSVDVDDLDPAVFPLLDALLHVQQVPDLGPFRSVTIGGDGMLLHFASAAVLLPAGKPDRASAPPLVAMLLDHQIGVALVPGSAITYAMLATGAPHTRTGSAIPAFLTSDGALSPLPVDTVAPTLAAPETRIIGGFHVPLSFAAMVATDVGALPPPQMPDAIARQVDDLARAGTPLREPVWIRAAGGYRLVQPFARRLLIWDPITGGVGATDAADAADSAGLLPNGGAGGPLLANLLLRLMSVEESVGVAVSYTTAHETLTLSLRGAAPYPAASVMKLAILAGCEDGIARGELQRDADVDALEEAMIVDSDNDAANELIDFTGRARINALMRRIGMVQSYLGSHFDTAYADDDSDNFLTPRESLLLMDVLLRGDVGDAARIRDLLARSVAPGSVRDALTATNVGLPLYEKRGWYDGVENDVARIDLGQGTTFTLAVFAPDVAESEPVWTLFADLARLGIEAGNGP